jgi:hypothetical protein
VLWKGALAIGAVRAAAMGTFNNYHPNYLHTSGCPWHVGTLTVLSEDS